MRILITFSLLLFCSTMMYAQQRSISGSVTSASDGSALPGVTVVVSGTSQGTITNSDGKYQISIPEKAASLTFSFVGMEKQTVSLGASNTYNVELAPISFGVDEVVVTALGVEKRSKGLTYSTQQVKGDELTRTKDVNMINSIAGKSAGVVITKSSSGVGGSSKVIIRGNRSASGNNQPLYVIDGIPMYNGSAAQPATTIGGNNDAGSRDGGDGIGNLNPDDIESINILKGASASALYGSQAANGVIVITTKKGKAGKTTIDFNSSTTFENVVSMPDFQNSYGMTSGGYSWDSVSGNLTGYNPKDFFNTGINTINSVSISSGTDKNQTYFSYANTSAKGIIDGNKLAKHNFNFRETAKFFNDKVTLDGSVNLINQKVNNRPTPGGYYNNPLVGLYRFPRGEDISSYQNNFEVFNTGRNLMSQNWHKPADTWEQNPWWLINRTPSEDVRNRVISSLTAKVQISKELSVQARGSADFTADKYEQKMYATTTPAIAGTNDNGRFLFSDNQISLIYGDVLLSYSKEINDISISATAGASINDTKEQGLLLDSRDGGLEIANVFSVGNMLALGYLEESKGHEQTQSVFGTAQIGFKDYLFLDVTGRNDWSSALAYTNSMKKGFFYPALGLTGVISDMVQLPEIIEFAKVRASYSSVGNSIPRYISYPTHSMNAGGSLIFNSEAPFSDLKPEISSSMEIGTEWRFLNNQVTFDFTYYKTNTKNQFFSLPAEAGSGYSFFYVNSGNIENKGVEVVLGLHPMVKGDFQWKNYFNFALNKNKILELHPDLTHFNVGGQTSSSYWMRLEEGGQFGDIYGIKFERDSVSGDIQIDGATGLPIKSSEFGKIANASPDFSLSWNGQLTYKDFTLNFLLDGRFGGDVVGMTQSDLDEWGVTQATADARNKGYVEYEGHQFKDVKGFYDLVGGRDGISEYYVYGATNIRLRELALSYNIPSQIFGKSGVIKGANFSLVGRNLFFLYNEAPYDPDAVLSTGNNLQGVDVFGMPTTRSLGFNIKISF